MILIVLLALLAPPTEVKNSDAVELGFRGPVREVVTTSRIAGSEQPGDIFLGANCQQCAFDAAGNRVFEIHRNHQGGVLDSVRRDFDARNRLLRETWSSPTGETQKQITLTYGPHGPTEIRSVEASRTTRVTTYEYGEGGALRAITLEDGGKVISRSEHQRDAKGNLVGWKTRDDTGRVTSHVEQSLAADNKIERIVAYGEDGTERLRMQATPTAARGGGDAAEPEVAMWRDPAAGENVYGSQLFFDGPRSRSLRSYRQDGRYDRTVYRYQDDDRRLPIEATRYDPDGNLVEKVTWSYTLDEHGNWTRREARVLDPASGSMRPARTDERVITYR